MSWWSCGCPVYFANNYTSGSAYGHSIPHAAEGFAFGAVAGLLMNHVAKIPNNFSSLFMMGLSAITAVNLGRNVANGNYNALTGITELSTAVLGFGASPIAMAYKLACGIDNKHKVFYK